MVAKEARPSAADRPWAIVSDKQYVGHGGKLQWTRNRQEAEAWAERLGANWKVVDAQKYVQQWRSS